MLHGKQLIIWSAVTKRGAGGKKHLLRLNILHSLPKYFNHFSAFLWPHLVVECRGPLSMFNCVSVPVPFTMLIIIIINVSAPPFLYLTNQFLGQYELAT